ncbi:hypothetical protein M409DRAFT_25395 [Zasmidium cellare ATCC 36951]|uniref:DNA helicase n=1 Tax=Zasmidium cellare ATCC 36951 TaxID=1080233 RepID=A0A6A6CEC4_ZASCE|nr:uncharacterized protein M409DRAFT_25395 [Zasmidium cellare ATCC 36951]KAF2164518.1 hypothetical protein M409DRAFT_25395 [Zasmidium cellare ATCC 36951]
MDRHDPIVDDTPNKRRRLNHESSKSGKAWDSQDDSGEEFTEDDFHTVATMPATDTQKRRFAYNASQLRSDLGGGYAQTSSQQSYTTQPTQTLHRATQPTQPLSSMNEVQVERSSPLGPSNSTQTQTQKPVPRPQFSRPTGVLANAMAPPGTTFRRPVNAQPKPAAINLDSDEDDPPVEHSDDETQGLSSTIKPTNFTRGGRNLNSSPNRVQESPRPVPLNFSRPATLPVKSNNAFTNLLGEFGYQPSAPQQARPADDMASAYGNARGPRPPQQPMRQNGPARALAPKAPAVQYKTLDDIPDYLMRDKVRRMKDILAELVTVDDCMNALIKKKGNQQDAMDYLADQEANKPDELSSMSPIQRKGVAKPTSQSQSQSQSQSSQPVRSMAKQTVQAPAKSIAEKYRRGSAKATIVDSDEDEDEDEDVKPKRGRIIQGRKPTMSSSPPSSPPPRSRLHNKKTITIDSDSEGDSGIVRDEPQPPIRKLAPKPTKHVSAEEIQASLQDMRDQRLLKLMNESTAHALSEVCGQSKDVIQFVLDHRPFQTLDDVSAVVKENLTKTGKKSKKTTPVGEKLVDDCREVMTGYDAIDELVVECEKIAQPVQEALRGWGAGETDGELQLMKLDEVHDSGIGTPASSCAPDDAPQKASKPKGNFFGQPSNMNPEMTMKDYQLVGLNWLCLLFKKKLSCILADDMGLGKTCQIIAFLSHLQLQKVDGVHLIIVPGSTLENWLREFERFSPGLNIIPYYGKQAERAELRYNIEQDWGTIDAIVTTYDMIVSKEDNAFFRAQGPFSCCIYDEAHALRNPNSQRYQQLVRIKADFKVLLTGTPLQNNLQELIAILAFIMPEMFQEKRDDLEYIFKHKASTKDTASAALLSNDRISRARTMMTPFILRRKKHQVLELPTKTTRVEYCDMTDSQANFYADVMDDAHQFYNQKAAGAIKGSAKKTSNVIMALRKAAIHPLLSRRIYDDKKLDKIVAALSKSDEFGGNPPDKIRAYLDGEAAQSLKGGDFQLHRFCYERDFLRKKFALKRDQWMDSGKAKKFAELVKQYADNGDRVLVFSQFTTLMDILEAVLETLQIKFMRLDGTTQIQERQDMIDKFTEDTSITVFMLSTRAGGAGINLAAANKVIIHDSGFNPQDDIQAENRAHRVGQTREVEVVRLVSRGTIEESIHALGESKLALDDRVAGGDGEKEADKVGEQMVEQMLADKLSCNITANGEGNTKGDGDLKDVFKQGLEGEGLKVSSKQAQF